METVENPESGLDSKSYLPSNVYDVLKWLNLVAIPAAVTAYLGLAQIWDWGRQTEVSATAMVLMTLMGVLLGVSQVRFNKIARAGNSGNIVIGTTPDGKMMYTLEVAVPVDKIKDLSKLTFGVKSQN